MSEKLSVCLINESFPPVIDGVANAVENYASIINKNYGKAVVAVPYYPDADDSVFPYKVVRFPSINTEKLVGYRAGYPFSAETVEEIKNEKINIIHTHCPFMSAFLARTLREPLDAPVIFTYHTKFDVDIGAAVKNRYVKKTVLKHLVSNIEACDEVWVVSEGAGENLRSIGYTGEYIVMPNGVDIPKGRVPEENIAEVVKGFDLPKEVPVFLFVGRMTWHKGIKTLIDALADIKSRGDDFRMVFVGSGRNFEEIKAYAKKCDITEKCVFTGEICEREDLRAWYCRADLFVFPSVYDTNGLVVREAAACGLASLLIEKSCAAEGITEGETGFLCKNTKEDFAEKLHLLCGERELLKIAGKKAMDKIYISWEDSVAAAAERYRMVLKNYRAGKYKKEQSLSDEWFAAEGEFLDEINRRKKLRQRLKKALLRYGKEKNKKLENSAKKFYCDIKEKRKKVKDMFREKLDKYL